VAIYKPAKRACNWLIIVVSVALAAPKGLELWCRVDVEADRFPLVSQSPPPNARDNDCDHGLTHFGLEGDAEQGAVVASARSAVGRNFASTNVLVERVRPLRAKGFDEVVEDAGSLIRNCIL